MRCFACGKRKWWWQKNGVNSGWHKMCSDIWEKGYDTAYNFCENENKIHGLPTPTKLYGRRGSIGEILPKELWRNQNVCKKISSGTRKV